ncbi:MAG: sulfatase [Planctomycetota bacterium]
MRRLLLVALSLLLFTTVTSAVSEVAAAESRPNVLFIAVDDMRPQLGCYGDQLVKSPNIDQLAARGMVFDQAYCQQALCSPSRISLLSGRYPATSGIYAIGPTLRSAMPDIVTLPQHFKNHGWFTRSLGKVYHVGIDDPDSWSVPSWQSKTPRYGPKGTAMVRAWAAEMKAKGIKEEKKGKNRSFYGGPAFEAVDCEDGDLLDGDTAREALGALRELAKKPEQPFFLAVGFANPHVPWVAPQKYFDLYDVNSIPLPPNNFVPKNAPDFAAKSGDDFYWYGNVPTDRKITPEFGRQCLQGYLAAISYIDAQVGKLLDAVDQLGLRDSTIIVLWGDHGYYMGEHSWWGGKHNNYEGATRAPLIVSVPGMKHAGGHTKGLVEFVDIYPTLVELAGLPLTEGLDGESFKPLLENPAQRWEHAAFSEYPKGGFQGTAMRTPRYRYVEWKDKKGSVVARELYDHQSDPQENENVAAKPEYAATVAELARQMTEIGPRRRK